MDHLVDALNSQETTRTTGPFWHDLYTVQELGMALDYHAALLVKSGKDLMAQELLVIKEALIDLNHKVWVAREGLAEAERIVKELTIGKVDPDAHDHHEDDGDDYDLLDGDDK